MNRTTIQAAMLAATLLASSIAAAGELTRTNDEVVCKDKDTGEVVLVADGQKIRLAYWEREPYFTKQPRTSRHKDAFPAPKNSTCEIFRKATASTR